MSEIQSHPLPFIIMLIEQPPKILRWLYPSALWRMNPNEKSVYLTFDDGPIPHITPWVLDLLDHYQIKATFFLVGDNVRKHPNEFQMILNRGHRVGNHTFNHIQGFKYLSFNYLANTNKADELIKSDLFRPPHGWMRWEQYMVLQHHVLLPTHPSVWWTKKVGLNQFVCFIGVGQVVKAQVFESLNMIEGVITDTVSSIQNHLEFVGMFPHIVAYQKEGSFDLVMIQ